ncbi:MAG: 3-hydroxyacyl-CoA dehydrogenase/enoyl-CoA hydratase family protein [Legionellaceae bacterium]|nr:3-hydroxyacyl-CoA dehydrogenase/enoyl-CoA hydratase family protein [Legionellaceae bacterium]
MSQKVHFRRIAVLGAGVMGAQIAAHCANAGLPTLLYDLAADGDNKNAIVEQAIARLAKLKPSPLGIPALAGQIKSCNYSQHLQDLSSCDLVIEAIGERLDWKENLYQTIAPALHENAVLVSNTSGLSINQLCEFLPQALRHRFCGVHFFNPPRYMHLAELIPARETTPDLLDSLESWLTRTLGKGVVRAKDTPNFIANRIGVFSLLASMHHAREFALGLDEVDALTGVLLGRPKSATFRTMDVVGLDTMQHVVATMQKELGDDPWHRHFQLPEWLCQLIADQHLGQKTGQGIYRKQGKQIEVYDYSSGQYRESAAQLAPEVLTMLKNPNATERFQQLAASEHKQARFLMACFCDVFHYCAYHLADIAHSTRDVDLAIRWGFGWQEGPFSTWQAAGIANIVQQLQRRIELKESMSDAALPGWLDTIDAFFSAEGAFSPAQESMLGRSQLAVYRRQYRPDRMPGESWPAGSTLYENEGVRLCDLGDDVAVIGFKSKANTIGQSVLDGMMAALDKAESSCQGVIIYQNDAQNFSSGADLLAVGKLLAAQDEQALNAMIDQFQQVALRLKYSAIPTVAAVRGRALGGGCELMMHCASRVAAFESYPGLVELGVGVIPAGGGCSAFAQQASRRAVGSDQFLLLKAYFEQIAMATVAGSALEAKERGFLQPDDRILMHAGEVLFAAKQTVLYLREMNYLPPQSALFQVAGREACARLQAGLVNWREGGFISAHDYLLASRLAYVLCGGDVNEGEWVDEAWILHLERQVFIELAMTEASQARIAHLLKTGKPLRN